LNDPDWPHPVIVGPMYRVGEEEYVCEDKARRRSRWRRRRRAPSSRQKMTTASRWRGLICAAGQRLTSKGCPVTTMAGLI